ncbi:ABC transporter permease [Bradyrhizobium sp. Arg237L]|uniref:ABC transporter permease n=1 Tax=Bradyrhizobium sp. Arg237L TaxID=3003352 RepID=UPI00249F6461|nr:ABC transporter permease [Bradyrhizobium sp. Arg237L]MDI4232741.1 ABC transporter permease [Bradyrhizobium sp. Arg237L]
MQRRDRQQPGFPLVFWRELAWLRRRPLLLMLTVVVPLGLMLLLTAILSAGIATRLPIAVLDLDGSELSRSVIRAVDATPDTATVLHVAELSEGRHLIVARKIRGLLMLPRNLERDVFAGRRPEVVLFYNTQTFTVGNLVLRGVNSAIPTVAAGIRISLRTAEGQPVEEAQAAITPIPLQTHALFNSTLNYVHFLLAALLPAVLQTVVVTTMAYAVGIDVETRHRFAILRRLGGGLLPAMFGKMLPYTILFLSMLGIADFVLFKYLELPLRGDPAVLVIAGIVFVLACQFIGALLALLLRPVAAAVSIATLLTAPAFGFMGIGFPRLGMNAFAYGYGELLPGTWYLMARIDQTIRGTPLDLSWKPVLVLTGFVAVLISLTAIRVRIMRRSIPEHAA